MINIFFDIFFSLIFLSLIFLYRRMTNDKRPKDSEREGEANNSDKRPRNFRERGEANNSDRRPSEASISDRRPRREATEIIEGIYIFFFKFFFI